MCKLERVRSGKFEVRDSYSLEDIESGNFSLINLLDCLDDYKTIELDDNTYFDAINGKEMPLDTDEDLVVMSFKGKLVSIYDRKSKGLYKAKRVWQ